jgi:CRP-like cAMP-binding protein
MGTLNHVDKVMALKSIEALKAVPTDQLSHVARAARERTYAPREILFQEGDPPGPLFIVLKGKVGLQRGGLLGAEVEAGSSLGAWSLFDDQPRTSDAVALKETQVLEVDREAFYDAIAEHPEIARSLFGDMVRRLRRTLLD